MLSFHDLEIKFGAAVAYQCLAEIEKASCISSPSMTDIDPEMRLANAIVAQDSLDRSVRFAA